MARVIIVEGMRGAGKTTVAKELEERTNHKYVKFERGIAPSIDMPLYLLEAWLTRRSVIIDRFHLSEYVMRTLDKKAPVWYVTLSTAFIHWLLTKMGAFTIILIADEDVITQRLIQRRNPQRLYDMSFSLAAHSWVVAGAVWPTLVMPCNTEIQKETVVSLLSAVAGE